MSFNKNWPRWIMASVAEHFRVTAATLALPLLVDGIDEREAENLHYDHLELRITGPYINELSHDYFKILVDVNVLLTDLMSNLDAYKLQTRCGEVALAMEGPIQIYKYGSEVGDDSSWVFCLTPAGGKIDPNRILYFGQLGKTERIRQAMVDGHFEVYIS